MNAKILSGANLAFIGDAYYELYIRHHLIKKGITNLDKLHKETLKYVSRTSQTIIFNKLVKYLTEEEINIYKKGRNYHYKERNEEYLSASGLEALIGYLYLSNLITHLEEIMELVIKLVEENK